VFDDKDRTHIPAPLQGATHYSLARSAGYEDLYRRLTDQPKTQKPKLGRRRALPERQAKSGPSMYVTLPIDVDLWNAAAWKATLFAFQTGRPPTLGIVYTNEAPARRIFEQWHRRYGNNDEFEELRISIIEGPIKGQGDGYSVHIGTDPDAWLKRLKAAGYCVSESDIYVSVSRINRMNPKPDSKNLELFKQSYREHKIYFLAPCVISKDSKSITPFFDLAIRKGEIELRNVSDVSEGDIDSVIFKKDT
jgi:hypothetical protein